MTTIRKAPDKRPQSIQRLIDLTLTPQDWEALQYQGSISREGKGNCVFFKLRFRRADGRQIVRYLGTDSAIARTLQVELDLLREPSRQRKQLAQVRSTGLQTLRETKLKTQAAVEALGYAYHGFSIRKRRKSNGNNLNSGEKT